MGVRTAAGLYCTNLAWTLQVADIENSQPPEPVKTDILANAFQAAVQSPAGFLRGRLGRQIDLKFTPELHFHADTSFDTASQVDELLSRPEVAQDLNEEGGKDQD